MRVRRTGSARLGNARAYGDTVSRFYRKYEVAPDGCWLWRDSGLTRGYATITTAGSRQMRAHRWSYEHFKGPIPDGMQIDHVCHNRDKSCHGGPTCRHRRCVNPDHLEVVDNDTNQRRSHNHYRNQTHCKYGHEFTPENTAGEPGRRRVCLACRKRNNKAMSLARAERNRAAREGHR